MAPIDTSVEPFVATTPSLIFPPVSVCEKENARSPSPVTATGGTGKCFVKFVIDAGAMFEISSMITL